MPNTELGDPFFKIEGGLNLSMLGDTPSNGSTETLSKFYLFGWEINFLMGLKEYGELLKKYSGKTDVAELKRVDTEISKKLSLQGKAFYRFGNECSMLKLSGENNYIL